MTIDVVELELKLIEIVMMNMTETNDTETRDDRDKIVITKGYDSITRSYRRGEERVRTIGLDWLLGVLLGGWGGWGGIPATLVPLAWPSPHPSPHSPLSQPFSSSPSTSI